MNKSGSESQVERAAAVDGGVSWNTIAWCKRSKKEETLGVGKWLMTKPRGPPALLKPHTSCTLLWRR